MSDDKCNCEFCFLYHTKKDYCALDGKKHKGCFQNFMPITKEQ